MGKCAKRLMPAAQGATYADFEAWALTFGEVTANDIPHSAYYGQFRYAVISAKSGNAAMWGRASKHTGDSLVKFIVGCGFESEAQYDDNVGLLVVATFVAQGTSSSYASYTSNGITTRSYGSLSARAYLGSLIFFDPSHPSADPVTGAREILNPT